MSARRPSVLLHLGLQKTGTTSVQWALAAATPELAGSGVLFPRSGREGYLKGVAHHGLAHSLDPTIRWRGPHAPVPEAPAELDRELRESPLPRALVSSEHLPFLDEPRVRIVAEHLGGREASALIVVRPPLEQALSSYNQRVKTGRFTGSFPDFVEEVWLRVFPGSDPARIARTWSRVLGEGRVRVVSFVRLAKDGCLVRNFLEEAGVPGSAHRSVEAVSGERPRNPSRPREGLGACRLLGKGLAWHGSRRLHQKALWHLWHRTPAGRLLELAGRPLIPGQGEIEEGWSRARAALAGSWPAFLEAWVAPGERERLAL